MPRLTRKDAELMIGLLRRHASAADGDTEESRLLRRLEQRVNKHLAALNNWKRREHAELTRGQGGEKKPPRTTESRASSCKSTSRQDPSNRFRGGRP